MSQLEKIKLGSGLTKNRTREDFRNDILIGLGAPIINIELTSDHLDQCINSALKQIWMHHRDGSFDNFYTYTITPDDASRGWMRIPENIDTVVTMVYLGQSGTPTPRIYEGQMGTEVSAEGENPPKLPTDTTSSNNATSAGSIGNLNFHDRMIAGYQYNGAGTPYSYSINGAGSSSGSWVGGQLRAAPGSLAPMSFGDFQEMKNNLENMKAVTGANDAKHGKCFKYARYQRKLYFYWNTAPGDAVCFHAYENIDPDLNPEYGEIFDDETLKNLATAYAKQMWGSILRKYGGVVLIGGVTLDGQVLVDEGSAEEEAILADLKNEQPTDFMIG